MRAPLGKGGTSRHRPDQQRCQRNRPAAGWASTRSAAVSAARRCGDDGIHKPVNSFNPPNQPKLPGGWKIPEGRSGAGVGIPGRERRRPVRGAVGMGRENAGQGDGLPHPALQLTGRTTANGAIRRN